MGVRAQLRELPAKVFSDIDWYLTHEISEQTPVAFLDKSWYELHLLFREKESPLRNIISGEREYPDGWPSLEVFSEGKGNEYYLALSSPGFVHKIAVALAAISESELIMIAHEKGIPWDSYMSQYLNELKTAYSRAAARENGLLITIA